MRTAPASESANNERAATQEAGVQEMQRVPADGAPVSTHRSQARRSVLQLRVAEVIAMFDPLQWLSSNELAVYELRHLPRRTIAEQLGRTVKSVKAARDRIREKVRDFESTDARAF